MDDLFNLYELPTGRRSFALSGMLQVAKELDFGELATHLTGCLEHETRVAGMESDWLRQKEVNEGARAQAPALDAKLDRTLGGIGSVLERLVLDFPGEPLAERAAQTRGRLFPGGVGAITSLAYESELAQAKVVLSRLQELSEDDRTELGIAAYAERLATLLPAFEEILTRPSTRTVTFDQLRELRAQGQRGVWTAVALVLGRHPTYSPQDVQVRQRYLAPLFDQNERVRQARASRGTPGDVDPATGVELEPTG